MSAINERNNLECEVNTVSDQLAIPDHAIDCLARCLLPELQKYFEGEAGKKAFAEWKALNT